MKNKLDKIKFNKKALFSIVAVVLIIAVGASIFVLTKSKVNTKIEFTLVKESGTVSYKNSDADQYINLDSDQIVLQNNAFVKTTDSYAHVIFADNSLMSIDVNSEVQITVSDTDTTINQILGNTWHRVEKLAPGKEYTVSTPTSLAAVRGTKFGVEAGVADSTTYVVEGAVDVGQVEVVNGQKEWRNRQSVPVGKSADIPDFKRVKKFDVSDISTSKTRSNWYTRNKLLDKLFDGKTNLRDAIKKVHDIGNTGSNSQNSLAEQLAGTNYTDPKICESYTSASYQTYMQSIDQLAKAGYDSTLIQKYRDYINAIFDACKDGILTVDEIQKINGILAE